MGKRVQSAGSRGSQLVVSPLHCSDPATPPHSSTPSHSQSIFLQFLTQLHQQPPNSQSQSQHPRALPTPQAADFLHFFNYQKYYSKIELQFYVICLANLITIGDTSSLLTATPEFRAKIRKFLQELSEEESNTSSYSHKVQAVFYILAVFIYQERSVKKKDGKRSIRSIIADKGIVRAILNISIPSGARISKFYGIIMVAITARTHPKAVREAIVSNILLNIARIEHQPTLFNLLVYLRSEKNKVRITFDDLRKGNVVKVLAQGYQRHIEQYQSYYMLDYLNYLLGLFPTLAEFALHKDFAMLLVSHLRLRNMHHPMHEATILGFIGRGLNLLEEATRQTIIAAIYSLEPAEAYTQSKIAKLLVTHDSSDGLLARIAQQNFLAPFIQAINSILQKNVLSSIVELFLSAIEKIRYANGCVSDYLLWQLRNKLILVGDEALLRLVEETHK